MTRCRFLEGHLGGHECKSQSRILKDFSKEVNWGAADNEGLTQGSGYSDRRKVWLGGEMLSWPNY